MQFMYQETCYFSSDYESELRSLADPVKMAAMTRIVQFPYSQPVSDSPIQYLITWNKLITKLQDVAEKTEAELAAAADRRREQGKRLQEMQAKQRAAKVCSTDCLLPEISC